jgi:hypothetical protein
MVATRIRDPLQLTGRGRPRRRGTHARTATPVRLAARRTPHPLAAPHRRRLPRGSRGRTHAERPPRPRSDRGRETCSISRPQLIRIGLRASRQDTAAMRSGLSFGFTG